MADPNSPDGPRGIYVLPMADTSHVATIHPDIRYAENSPFQALDLYLPATPPPEAGYPLVIFVHGGAWMMCDKRDIQLNAPLQALERGYAVASLNYRLSSEAIFPAQIHDVKAAIGCLRGLAVRYGLDADRFAIWGASAGAQLASLAGTSAGIADLRDRRLGWSEQSDAVRAVVSWFGPTDFLKMDPYLRESGAGTPDHSAPDSPESRLLGGPITDRPDAVRRANPETWLTPACPPFLLMHGTADPIVPYQLSVDFAARIDAAAGAGTARLRLLDGLGHAGPEFDAPAIVGEVLDFLDEVLAPVETLRAD